MDGRLSIVRQINGWLVPLHLTVPPNSAYISSDGNAANYNYDNTAAHISHFYQQVTIPVNATNVLLSFQLKGNAEFDFDDFIEHHGLEVYADPSLVPPVADVLPDVSAIANLSI